MSDMISAEEAQKLMDGTTPGPWADRFPGDEGVVFTADDRIPVAYYVTLHNRPLIAAAPDLARTVIALHAQLADAKAAQVMVVERAAACCPQDNTEQHLILALADTDGEALVRELRERAEKAEAEVARFREDRTYVIGANDGWDAAVEQGEASPAVGTAMVRFWKRLAETHNSRAEDAEADRDRLAAANAALEAKVARLVGAVREYHLALDRRQNGNTAGYRLQDEVQRILEMPWHQGAALTEVQARDKGEGGE